MPKPLVLPLLLWKFFNSDFQSSVFHQSLRAVTFHTCCFQFVWCLYLLVWICQDLIKNWHLISFRWKWIPLRHLEKTHEVTSKSVTISPMFSRERSVYYHLRDWLYPDDSLWEISCRDLFWIIDSEYVSFKRSIWYIIHELCIHDLFWFFV